MVLHHQSKNNSKQPSGYEEIKLEKPAELFWFITQRQKFSQTCCFHKIIAQNNIHKKPFPEKPSDKTFIVKVNQDAVTLTFIR